jgi:hypothetical protein
MNQEKETVIPLQPDLGLTLELKEQRESLKEPIDPKKCGFLLCIILCVYHEIAKRKSLAKVSKQREP